MYKEFKVRICGHLRQEGSEEEDLVSSMARKLRRMEEEVRRVKEEKKEAERELERTRKEKEKLEQDGLSHQGEAEGDLEQERRTNRLLRKQLERAWKQVYDMKGFLADYGMVWVGDGNPESSSSSSKGESEGLPMAMEELQKRVEELNEMAGDGEAVVAIGDHGERMLQPRRPLELTIYSDSFRLGDSQVRPFASGSGKRFFNDIRDGYFPSELRGQFPEGVPFSLVDRTDRAGKPGPQCKPKQNVHSLSDGPPEPDQPSSSAQAFLNRLPPTVIRNGKVVDVRGGVREELGLNKPTESRPDSREERRQNILAAVERRLNTNDPTSQAGRE